MKSIYDNLNSIQKIHKLHTFQMYAALLLGIVAALAVSWALHINGITLTSADPLCGQEEHTHTDDCYEWVLSEDTETETESTEATEVTEAEGTEAAATEGTQNAATEGTETAAAEGIEEVSETTEESAPPQAGDTKTDSNGETYIYTLVCGMEEHTHTDACYESEDTEEASEEVPEETTEIAAEEETNAASTGTTIAGVSASLRMLLGSSSGGGNSGISVTSLGASASSYSYYFADGVSLLDASKAQDEDYIVYTIINGTYYIVDAEGNLIACTDLSDSSVYTTEDAKVTASADPGVYVWSVTNGVPSFKCTANGSTYDFADYRWVLTSTDADASTGTGTYTVENEENSVYLAPEVSATAETLSYVAATASDASKWTSSTTALSGTGQIIYTLTDISHRNGTLGFTLYLYDSNNQSYMKIKLSESRVSGTDWSNAATFTPTLNCSYSATESNGSITIDPTVTNTLTVTIAIESDKVTITYYNATSKETYTYTVTTDAFASGAKAYFTEDSGGVSLYATTIDASGNSSASYNRVAATSNSVSLTAAASGSGWTSAAAGNYGESFSLLGQYATGGSAIEWVTSTTAGATTTGTTTSLSSTAEYLTTTFYLASVREYTVYFDGSNGGQNSALAGVIYYRGAAEKALTSTADAYGNLTVTAPSISNAQYTTDYVEYKLRGWVNIYSGNYKYAGDTVTVTDNTVFYADWEVASYDIGQNVNTVTVPDTSSFIKTYMFDYNDIINLYTANLLSTSTLSQDGHYEAWTWTDGNSAGSYAYSGTGVLLQTTNVLSSNLDFMFLGAGTSGVSLAYPANRNARNSSSYLSASGTMSANTNYMGIVTSGIAGTTASTDSLIKLLFDQSNVLSNSTSAEEAVLGKTYVGEGYNLFQYNEDTGYYYYDSTKNAASYNQSAKTFYVYNYTVMTNASNSSTENYTDFLPFNYSATSGNVFNVYTVDYWFGMQTDIEFYLPNDSDSTAGSSANQSMGNDMVFKFSGDDDVWVYVDDTLVLDLGGMHAAVYGEINFSTGEVTVAQNGAVLTTDATTQTIDVDTTNSANGTVTTTTTSFSAGYHTLTVYYLERGASQSNLAVYSNITPMYSLKLFKQDIASQISGTDTGCENSLVGTTFAFYDDEDLTEASSLYETITGGTATNTFTVKCYCSDSSNCTNCTCGTEGSTSCSCTCSECSAYLQCYGLQAGHTYYLKETAAVSGYLLDTGKIIRLEVGTDGSVTITVLNRTYSDGNTTYTDDVVESYTVSYNSGGSTSTRTDYSTSEWDLIDYDDSDSIQITAKTYTQNSTDYTYYELAFTANNQRAYELPATGSIGVFPYRKAGAALVLIAISGLAIAAVCQYLRMRRLRRNQYHTGHTKEDTRRRGSHERTRGHPRE